MSPEFQERLFEPYAREMRFSDRRAAGTGLGMSITKSLVSLMEGGDPGGERPRRGERVHGDSSPLPRRRSRLRRRNGGGPGALSLEGLAVLLAEDNEINMEIADEMLTSQGAHVTPGLEWGGGGGGALPGGASLHL